MRVFFDSVKKFDWKERDCLRPEGEGLHLRESELNAIDPRRVGVLLRFSNRLEKLLEERKPEF